MPRLLTACCTVLALALLAACTRADSAPATNVAASGGEVAATPAAAGVAPGLSDSVSTRADAGRIRGSTTAPVWLVEVSDFQCPYCKEWHDKTFPVIDREYVQTGKVRLAYLNFPLSSIHPNARRASEAAMCAAAQGKFWELHDSLFDTQQKWSGVQNPMTAFDSLAVAAGTNAVAWRDCMTTSAAAPIIDADIERSRKAGVQSTPTFFVGDRKIEGAFPADSFRVAIEQALAKARGPR